MTETVLITGVSGFVGSHTAAGFVDAGWKVVGLDVRRPVPGLWPREAAFEEGDILDRASVERVLSTTSAQHVVHAAGIVGPERANRDPELTVDVNVVGTARVLGAANEAGVQRMTYLSTATLYGQFDATDTSVLTEDRCPRPVGVYDATKLMGETYALSVGRRHGLDVAALRPSYVYGPGSGIGDYLIHEALQGRAVERPAGQDHPCEFTYVKDLASAVLRVHTDWRGGQRIFNVSSGQIRTRGEFADLLAAEIRGVSIRLGPGIQPGGHLRPAMSLERIRSELGYTPAYSLEAGVREWVRWERQQPSAV
jgi:nucleoside-diphosphate-sugar epimerase